MASAKMKKLEMLSTTSKKVLDFYTKNPQINFETINCIVVDFLENMLSDLTGTINNSITHDILNNVKDISSELISYKTSQILSTSQLQSELTNLNDKLNKLNTEITNSMFVKLVDIKKSYLDDLKNALNTSDTNTLLIIEKQNDIILSKTMNALNDIIPKNNTMVYNQFELLIIKFREEVSNHLRDLGKNTNDLTSEKISNILDTKYSQLITNLQQPILSYISSSEERLSVNLNQIKDSSINQGKMNEKIHDFLNKYNTNVSINIGKIGEDKLYTILNSLFPAADVENTSGKSKYGDFILKRQNMIDILFENKQYTNNVPKDEVFKFIRDCDENNFSGIMVSNTSGIATKNNFQIDIHDKNILIYLHNAHYNEDLIYTAVNLIDYLYKALSNIEPSKFNPLTDEELLCINQEFQTFLNKKETLINYIRDTNKRVIQQIIDIELPSLHKYLASKFATTKTLDLKCNICENFTGKNNKSLASHKKTCSIKNTISDKDTSDENIITTDKPLAETTKKGKPKKILSEKKDISL